MLDLHPCRRKDRYAVVPFTSKDEYQISHTDPIPVLFIYLFYRIAVLMIVSYFVMVARSVNEKAVSVVSTMLIQSSVQYIWW